MPPPASTSHPACSSSEKIIRVMKGTKVFIRDDAFIWLPAELAAAIEEGDSTASVAVALPDDWQTYTVSPNHPSLRMGSVDEDTGRFVRRVKLADYPGGELPLQNVDDKTGETMGKSDMADLPHLHEAAILYNLKDRHKRSVPYTRVGDIVVAVNPYQWFVGLYSEKKRHFYAQRLVWNVEEEDFSNRQDILEGYFDRLIHDPHVCETACNAYCGLALDGRDQAILVSGESGAGKTESVKIVLTHLATIENTCEATVNEGGDVRTGIVAKISESNPLFEAFGNAKTARNDNSSRFGKLTKLHFHTPDGSPRTTIRGKEVTIPVLAGNSFETYLLEKSRVVTHNEGERSYHLFYQLLSAPEEDKVCFWEEGLSGATCDSFRYVGVPELAGNEERSDAECWTETKEALVNFGFKGGKLRTLVRAVCVVLQLGNVIFGPDPSDDEGSIIASAEEFDKLSALIGISGEALAEALTTRRLKTFGEEITVRLTPAAAKDGCDALAKEIYAQLFQVLVETINDSSKPVAASEALVMNCISILDMFGFESFADNRFEQLCINYANERIQHKYASDTFLSIKEEYEAEGIEIYDFSKVDNTDVLHLIESRTGLINVLNEECVRPKGNDESFVYKIKTIHKESGCLVKNRLHRSYEFSVAHFAEVVTYTATGFVERNTDKLPSDVLSCVAGSRNELISGRLQKLQLASVGATTTTPRKRAAATITSKFKRQLTLLMNDIADARTRYVRCIKPNSSKQPLVMDHEMVMRQLASAGLVTAITVSRETFPNHLPYDVVWDRFHLLLPVDTKPWGRSDREKAELLLEQKLQGREKVVGGHIIAPFACGKTKVFFRSGSLELLESERLGVYSAKATILQRWARAFMAERRLKAFEPTVVIIQTKWRGRTARTAYLGKRNAAIVIQCWARRTLASSKAIKQQQNRAATTIQSLWRMQKPREVLRRSREATRIIQRLMKTAMNQQNLTSAMATVVEEAQMDRKVKILQGKLEHPLPDNKDSLLKESALIIEYLSRQLYKQRGRVSDLKAELSRKGEANLQKAKQARSTEAALAANKLEVHKLRSISTRLEHQLGEQKAGKANMRSMLETMQNEHKNATSTHLTEQKALKIAHRKEIGALENEIRLINRRHAVQLLELSHKMSKKEKEHRSEIVRLQKEMRKSEASHADDLSNLLTALETAHEEDTKERSPPDEEVLQLQQHFEDLESKHEIEVRELKSLLCDKCFQLCENSAKGSHRNENKRPEGSGRFQLSRSFATREVTARF